MTNLNSTSRFPYDITTVYFMMNLYNIIYKRATTRDLQERLPGYQQNFDFLVTAGNRR